MGRITGNVDELDDMADLLQMDVERLQELGYAAAAAGGSSQALGAALQKLVESQGEAINGNQEMLQLFKEVGLSANDLRKMSRSQLLDQILEFTGNLPKTERNVAALAQFSQGVFGRGGKDLTSFLRLGKDGVNELAAEARRTGAVIGRQTVADYGALNNKIQATKQTIFASIAEGIKPVLPEMVRLLDRIAEWVAANKGEMGRSLVAVLQGVEKVLPKVNEGLSRAVYLVMALNSAAEKLGPYLPQLSKLENMAPGVAGLRSMAGWLQDRSAEAGVAPSSTLTDALGANLRNVLRNGLGLNVPAQSRVGTELGRASTATPCWPRPLRRLPRRL